MCKLHQPKVEVTSCFVYKVMGLTFHIIDLSIRVSGGLLNHKVFFRFESHWLLFFYSVFFFFFFWGGGGLILLISSCLIFFFLFIFLFVFIPLICITSVTTQTTVNSEIYANSVKIHICDVKICD